jgi:integrase
MTERKMIITMVNEYLTYRRKLGYQLRSTGDMLLDFADYVERINYRGPITTDVVIEWARLPKNVTLRYWAGRVEAVRGFAKYCAIFDPDTEIPPVGVIGPAHNRVTPHIYSLSEISDLLQAARTFRPADGLRPRTYETLFGLLACTGIRISEALSLTHDDVDLKQGILTIRETKFRKSRLVPLHPSTTRALRKYARFRDRYHPLTEADTFLMSEGGYRVIYSTVRSAFRKIRQILGWDIRRGKRMPRIHDLRHTFVCHRLLQWYKEGIDIDHSVAVLSTYVGHASVKFTYWYMTAIPDLFKVVTERFEQYARKTQGDTQ